MSSLRGMILDKNSFDALKNGLHVKELLNPSMPPLGHLKGKICKR